MFLTLVAADFRVVLALIQENAATDFGDLGKLLLGGVLAAAIVAVSFTVIRFRMRDKRPPANSFISINSFQKKD